MLFTETVEAQTLDLIKTLQADEQLRDFNLVGGTALSLRIGHRKSIDIDLFIDKAFNDADIADHLTKVYTADVVNSITNGVFCFIKDIKVDLIAHQYPYVKKVDVIERIRMVSLEDIAAMKLNAIVQSGHRLKDFVDIYFLLEQMP